MFTFKQAGFEVFKKIKKLKECCIGNGIGSKIPIVAKLYFSVYKYLNPKKLVLIETKYSNKMYVDSNDQGINQTLIMTGEYEKFESELFRQEVKPGMTVLDIGANIGYYTLLAAKLVGKKGKVYAFEPEPYNYSLLEKSIKINKYNNVIAFQKAVSNHSGTIKLHLLKDMSTHRIYKTQDSISEIDIQAVNLDTEFKNNEDKINIIKMDVEGAELIVLQSMNNILSQSKSLKIFIEFSPILITATGHSPEEFNELKKYGFNFFYINEDRKKIEPITIKESIKLCIKKQGPINLLCTKHSGITQQI